MAIDRINIIQGEDQTIDLYFIRKDSKRPFSLNGATEIEVRVPKDGGYITKLYTLSEVSIISVPELGHIQIELSALETVTLKVGKQQPLYASATIAGKVKPVNATAIMDVEAPAVA